MRRRLLEHLHRGRGVARAPWVWPQWGHTVQVMLESAWRACACEAHCAPGARCPAAGWRSGTGGVSCWAGSGRRWQGANLPRHGHPGSTGGGAPQQRHLAARIAWGLPQSGEAAGTEEVGQGVCGLDWPTT